MSAYTIANDYFMAHQPAFMLGMIALYLIAIPCSIACVDLIRNRRNRP